MKIIEIIPTFFEPGDFLKDEKWIIIKPHERPCVITCKMFWVFDLKYNDIIEKHFASNSSRKIIRGINER